MGMRHGDKNVHTHTYRPMRMVCHKLKSKANSTLCASASINVFICLSRKLLSTVMNSCSSYWFCYLFLALDFFVYFGILMGRPIFNETHFIYFSLSLFLSVWQTFQAPNPEAALYNDNLEWCSTVVLGCGWSIQSLSQWAAWLSKQRGWLGTFFLFVLAVGRAPRNIWQHFFSFSVPFCSCIGWWGRALWDVCSN